MSRLESPNPLAGTRQLSTEADLAPGTQDLSFPSLIQNPRLQIPNSLTPRSPPPAPEVVRLRLLGANAYAAVAGADELPGKVNYLLGNDPQKWRTNVPTYAKVKYSNVYPGIDLVYYGNQGGQLEYDFVVAPGADPRANRLEIVGAVR